MFKPDLDRKKYPKLMRWGLRRLTSLRGIVRPRPKIVFIHIPKTAGTTVRTHIRSCIGSNGSGRSVNVVETPGRSHAEQLLRVASGAGFVHGHMSWSSVERLELTEAFRFTFLRSPRERLESLYQFLAYRRWSMDDENKALHDACDGLTPRELSQSRNRAILFEADNYMVRQLADDVWHYPVPSGAWPGMLEKATQNLLSLDFVGTQDTFDQDFAILLSLLNLPKGGMIRRLNATAREIKDTIEIDPVLYEWDQKLFDRFMAGKRSGIEPEERLGSVPVR